MRLPRRTRPALAALALGLGATSARAADQVAEKSPSVAPATKTRPADKGDVKVVDKGAVGKAGASEKSDGHKDVKAVDKGAVGKAGSDVKGDGLKDVKAVDKGAVGKAGSDVKGARFK